MSGHVESVPSVVDRIKHTMVGLKMPRAIEILDATVRRLERGELTALEAIDALLAEEFTLRENRRVKTALVMARLSEAVKKAAGGSVTWLATALATFRAEGTGDQAMRDLPLLDDALETTEGDARTSNWHRLDPGRSSRSACARRWMAAGARPAISPM